MTIDDPFGEAQELIKQLDDALFNPDSVEDPRALEMRLTHFPGLPRHLIRSIELVCSGYHPKYAQRSALAEVTSFVDHLRFGKKKSEQVRCPPVWTADGKRLALAVAKFLSALPAKTIRAAAERVDGLNPDTAKDRSKAIQDAGLMEKVDGVWRRTEKADRELANESQ